MPNPSIHPHIPNADKTDAVELRFEDRGGGFPLVLLHGYCGDGRYWSEVVPALAAKYRVIVPDLRGHGGSPAPDGVYSMESLADDVIRLMDRLGIGRAFLFGHSLGGYVALALAERHPERLLGFGLIHSTPLPDTEAGKEGRLAAAERIRTEGVKPFVDGLVPKLFAPAHRTSMADRVNAALEIGYGTSPRGAVGCALGMRERPDRTAVLRRTALPILLLAGELDEVVPPERRFPVDLPHIRAVTLPGSGHMSMMEDPERLSGELTAFLEAIPGAGENAE
ncbi:alpha/beta fold hydrolase [Cohnella caldifontis]|uniref:alpha/beta fold hydrolase n=1 Tax=Cohnella caldifontis TaxID=3027471 RepID=UPI0023EB978D|nr:alpha/beta fold hydrolase [Cohnella sp. YIM B05605]